MRSVAASAPKDNDSARLLVAFVAATLQWGMRERLPKIEPIARRVGAGKR